MPRRLITATLLAIGLTNSIQAQNITPEGAARSASVQAAIVQFCGAYHIIDGPKAVKLSAAAREIALQIYPRGKGKAAVDREFQRRFNEVQTTQPQFWCQYQREVQKSLGSGVFLD